MQIIMKLKSFFCTALFVAGMLACSAEVPSQSSSGKAEPAKPVEPVFDEYGEKDVKFMFNVEARFDDHPLQAMAIHDNMLFQCYDSGRCRTYDLKSGRHVADIFMDCLIASNHCGNANFGKEYPDGNSMFPALYVSGDLTNKCCYVMSVNELSTVRIQTINFKLNNEYGGSQVIIDKDRERIVYMQRKNSKIGEKNNCFAIFEFPLPKLKEKEVTFTDADVLDSYDLDTYLPVYQGACIKGGKIYQTYGTGAKSAGIAIFDLKTHKMERNVSVKNVIPYEPQSVCIYKGKTIMNFGGKGVVYEIKDID